MICLADSSVLVASLSPDEARHEVCSRLVASRRMHIYLHALSETFAALTGGRDGIRVTASAAARLLRESVRPYVETVTLSMDETLAAMDGSQQRGVRGGAVYDYLHLVAARKAKAQRLYTLNVRHFQAFHRAGDPEIVLP